MTNARVIHYFYLKKYPTQKKTYPSPKNMFIQNKTQCSLFRNYDNKLGLLHLYSFYQTNIINIISYNGTPMCTHKHGSLVLQCISKIYLQAWYMGVTVQLHGLLAILVYSCYNITPRCTHKPGIQVLKVFLHG